MDALLGQYERELARLRVLCREYAERYPKIAARLRMDGDACDDPHVERLIEAVALMSARISQRLDDSVPEFTEALLHQLYPHYLRPFPSCAIARFVGEGGAGATHAVARGTRLDTTPHQGLPYTFTTAYSIAPSPISILAAEFHLGMPSDLPIEDDADASISLLLKVSEEARATRLFIDGDASFSAALRDALFMNVAKVYAQTEPDGPWRALSSVPLRPVGFEESDALIPFEAKSEIAYRLLTEYFAYPEKFNFFDLDVGEVIRTHAAVNGQLGLRLILKGIRGDSPRARLLSGLSSRNLLLGCTPVVNLFKRPGVPRVVDLRATDCALLADNARPEAYEIYSVDRVALMPTHAKGNAVVEFLPFYANSHSVGNNGKGHYWLMRHDDALRVCSPGHETSLSLVGLEGEPLEFESHVLSVELSCTNRDLPSDMQCGAPEGDLFIPGTKGPDQIRLIRRPAKAARFAHSGDSHWRLISHLSCTHQTLMQAGVEGLREILSLYDIAQSSISRRIIGGIRSLHASPSSTWMRFKGNAVLVFGVEVRVTVDEEAFAGTSIHLFAQVLDFFFAQKVALNTFIELVLLSHQTGKEVYRCQARSGMQSLL
ncbi:type VI secretion system baseplate subunit TssF [Massilia sp. TS11]|uniref:type VI secretion system baseplate subunit TssF n=1 Tax=Massilia sp. TS11 TaxID=2908003 RepID=UPI001EDA396E|nr:type VI secretion system baseplate subunit TssF [Massilia sp. TS11]MCG2586840.1 type VI secretion system baseplate subunit TssF [Massilia sp. TS11]